MKQTGQAEPVTHIPVVDVPGGEQIREATDIPLAVDDTRGKQEKILDAWVVGIFPIGIVPKVSVHLVH